MTARLDISNRALLRISATPLQSESAPGADDVFKFYDDNLALLTAHKYWTFSLATLQLARDNAISTPPDFWLYRYVLPVDRVAPPLEVYDQKRTDNSVPGGLAFNKFELQDKYLLTDAEKIYVRYQKKPDPAIWPALFRECVILALAGDLAVLRHEDMPTRTKLHREVFGDERVPGDLGLLGKAANADAQASPSQVIPFGAGPLISVRR
ncbi:MAG: hypothetical protein ACRCS9_13945 [Hyphomicrobium sp.]